MEIKFNDVVYKEHSNIYDINFLNGFTYKFKNNSITGVICDDNTKLCELIPVIKRPISGTISLDKEVIDNKYDSLSVNNIRRNIAVVNCSFKKRFLTNSVRDEINLCLKNYNYETNDYEKRIIDSLKLVGLDETFIDKNPNELSSIEQKKLIFASVMSYNPEVIIFENYETGMNFRDKDYLKKLLRILRVKHNKTIIIVSNNIDFLMNIVDNFVVIHNGINVFEGTKKDFYNDEIYRYVEMPKIIEFVKYVNENGHKIEEYTELKELIKGIYRDVS